MLALRLGALCALVALVTPTAVDNGVEGEPEIECGPTSISVSFNTKNPFEGHVYVKGLFAQAGCRTDGDKSKRVGAINLPFDSCSVKRTRSLSPRGLFIGTTVIISFHPQFETKVDRAYVIQCFYMEADKTVSTELEVSGLTTLFASHNVPMPICRYQLLQGSATGAVIKFAVVGTGVYHKWTCDTETVNTFCMTVHGCFVDDGKGDRVQLLDDKGCALDKYLMPNLEYQTDLMAGGPTWAFKYADRSALYFQCQISLTIKEPGGTCAHPTCAEPTKGKKKRSVSLMEQLHQPQQPQQPTVYADSVGTRDVWAEMTTLDMDENTSHRGLVDEPRLANKRQPFNDAMLIGDNVCISSVGFGLIVAVATVLAIGTTVALAFVCLRRPQKL